jgi:hypothetical protein
MPRPSLARRSMVRRCFCRSGFAGPCCRRWAGSAGLSLLGHQLGASKMPVDR